MIGLSVSFLGGSVAAVVVASLVEVGGIGVRVIPGAKKPTNKRYVKMYG